MAEIGQIIGGRYRLERMLGEGGMGAVYEASHVQIGSKAAIKFLHPGFSENSEAVQRFQLEAQAAAAVGHDSIVRIHDIGKTDDDAPYLVMEMLRGRSLGEAIAEGEGLSIQELIYVACQVLSGLCEAHDAGIVHRDLKPDNIFLVDTGALLPGVKILDFGISRVTGLFTDEEEVTRLTQTGIVLGTPAYMSPEHARGRSDIDGRSDIFSVGIILYECLTGSIPFDGPNYNAVLAAILTEEPIPPSTLRPDLPEPLEAAILRALEKDRSLRYQNAREMFEDLLPLLKEWAVGRVAMPTGAKLPPTRRVEERPRDTVPEDLSRATVVNGGSGRRRWALLLGLLLLMLVAGMGIGLAVVDQSAAETPVEAAVVPEVFPPSPPVEAGVVEPDPRLVIVELVGLPEGARVSLDGAEIPSLPLRLSRGGAMRALQVDLEGHHPFRRIINPNDDQTIEVELVAIVDAEPPLVEEGGPERPTKRPIRHPIKRPVDSQGGRPTKRPTYVPDFVEPTKTPVYRPRFIE